MTSLKKQEQEELLKMTEKKIAKMHQDKKQAPSLIIPKSLLSFSKTSIYQSFLFSIYQYCVTFNETIKKYNSLKEKMQGRVSDEIILLQKQKDQLNQLEKELSYQYAQILLDNACKSVYKDQFFFQTLIYLISRVIKQFFAREDFLLIEEEVNRLFRTNRYNLIKKRHQNDLIMKQFPALKEETKRKKINLTTIINKAPEKMIAYRQLEKKKRENRGQQDYTTILGVNQMKDELQRSPLICTWLPSRKSMLNDFTRPKFYSFFKTSTQNQPNQDL